MRKDLQCTTLMTDESFKPCRSIDHQIELNYGSNIQQSSFGAVQILPSTIIPSHYKTLTQIVTLRYTTHRSSVCYHVINCHVPNFLGPVCFIHMSEITTVYIGMILASGPRSTTD